MTKFPIPESALDGPTTAAAHPSTGAAAPGPLPMPLPDSTVIGIGQTPNQTSTALAPAAGTFVTSETAGEQD